MSSSHPDILRRLLEERIVILDGAMGTMIQTHGLGEADYRGERFAAWESDLKVNNDLLSRRPADRVLWLGSSDLPARRRPCPLT